MAVRTGGAASLWVVALFLAWVGPRPVEAEPAARLIAIRADPAGLLAALAALVAAGNFLPAAWRSLARVRLDMNVLMTTAIVAAVLIGEPLEAATLAVLFSFAELLERAAVQRGRNAITRLLELAPSIAEVVAADGTTSEREVRSLVVGDRIRVRPGHRIAADGVVLSGESTVNESTITGESLPVRKEAGDGVFAGTFNFDGVLELDVRTSAGESLLDRIVQTVRTAEARRAPIAVFVDRFARIYTPIVTLLALAVAVGPPLFGAGDTHDWFLRGVTLLVIACPCALVIATPVTVVSALTSAARHGVLIKGGEYLEALARVRAIAVDKTGTLTTGELRVEESGFRPPDRASQTLRQVAALESRSEHPTAAAIVRHAAARGVTPDAPVEAFAAVPGKGVQGVVQGTALRIGSERFVGEAAAGGWGVVPPDATAVFADAGAGVHARFVLRDTVRQEAPSVVRALHALGVLPVVLLSGDAEESVRAVAAAVGIDDARWRLLPEEKLRAVKSLGERHGGVAMLGDGVNDAPALATATVGIAMGVAGSPASIETADVALMRDDLDGLPYAIRLSRRALHLVRLNIGVALAVKLLLAVGTVAGLVSLSVAVLVGDVGGTVLVTLNALRLTSVPSGSAALRPAPP